jgi:hypothetical protein
MRVGATQTDPSTPARPPRDGGDIAPGRDGEPAIREHNPIANWCNDIVSLRKCLSRDRSHPSSITLLTNLSDLRQAARDRRDRERHLGQEDRRRDGAALQHQRASLSCIVPSTAPLHHGDDLNHRAQATQGAKHGR